MLDRAEAKEVLNRLGSRQTPFFFFTNFIGTQTWVKPLHELSPDELLFDFGGKNKVACHKTFSFSKNPVSREVFSGAFRYVISRIRLGDSYLVNLTFRHPVVTDLSLSEIYAHSKARYKLLFRDQFVVFSPETFVRLEKGYIYAYPMKGTIDAAVADAARSILNDPKETAEHVTIVDLIRNDLSQIATEVEVTRFRMITEVVTHEKTLLQVSSEIRGKLPDNYQTRLGDLLFQLLPAGSVSGAPKAETLRIIEHAEKSGRGFYTGICGLFDGQRLDTAVMIRFIEQEADRLYYRSGGGITAHSEEEKEYQEMVDKIYLPI